MAGAEFVRADLHVHTIPDSAVAAPEAFEEYIRVAVDRGVRVLGITDHNTVRNVRGVLAAAAEAGLLVLPGIEITTHEGHLLALFGPDAVTELEEFATQGVILWAGDPRDGTLRSLRSMVDLVGEIGDRGGLAIPAHVDARDGMLESISSTALASLLAHPALAALEFGRAEALREWFSPNDPDPIRREAWLVRQRVPDLAARGLARIMSSDAHSPDKVGQDRSSRTLTRLRLDHLNFEAVRNAVLHGPRARCKAEVNLPPSYPRIVRARFDGGFLDQVEIEFSPNLNCLIGGRGSGKSTALLAVRAALGAAHEGDDAQPDDPDDPGRMPDRTVIGFIDAFGSERTAIRERYDDAAHEDASGAPIALHLQGFGQGESGRLARGYRSEPEALLRFLDQFVDIGRHDAEEDRLFGELEDNASEVQRTSINLSKIGELERKLKELEAQLTAAEKSRVEEIAQWAGRLASIGPLLARVRLEIDAMITQEASRPAINLDSLARDAGVNLRDQRVARFVEGERGLRVRLQELHRQRAAAGNTWRTAVAAAAAAVQTVLDQWSADRDALQRRLDVRQKELEAMGLRVQAGAVREVATQIERVRKELSELKERRQLHRQVQVRRRQLLDALHANRGARFERRKATLRQVVQEANAAAGALTIHLRHVRTGIRGGWEAWLGRSFKFRTPRVERVARALSPREMADHLLAGGGDLLDVELDGERFFTQADVDEFLPGLRTWPVIFDLQTMRLDDRVLITIQEAGAPMSRDFDQLSAGQQRSVLLSLILCARGSAPLILDQPEDHLDAPYIARALVGHLEAAKERRQVILATHSANLTVLGDAELVLPMYADAGHGAPHDPGAVDRPETRVRVCELLEGGLDAFRRRGERYGLRFR